MGLTFKKRDEFEKLMDGLGVSSVDLVNNEDELAKGQDKATDPFAKFLEPKVEKDGDKSVKN